VNIQQETGNSRKLQVRRTLAYNKTQKPNDMNEELDFSEHIVIHRYLPNQIELINQQAAVSRPITSIHQFNREISLIKGLYF